MYLGEFTCHFVAPHHPPPSTSTGMLVVFNTSGELSKLVSNLISYLINMYITTE